jgi:predicted hydrocarbon binding protein
MCIDRSVTKIEKKRITIYIFAFNFLVRIVVKTCSCVLFGEFFFHPIATPTTGAIEKKLKKLLRPALVV